MEIMKTEKRIEALKAIGFVKNNKGWIEETSQILFSDDNIVSMTDDEFEEEIGFIEYVLSK